MVSEDKLKIIKKISDTVWEIPKSYKGFMRVPGRIIANQKLLLEMDDAVIEQTANVASLPGIVGYSFAMPDAHWGYGFPIGGVAAFDVNNGGVISPGGIGFDINCGMRLVRTDLTIDDVKPKIKELIDNLFERVPCGVGSKGFLKLNKQEFKQLCEEGALWIVDKGFGWKEDLETTEENGCMEGADANKVSEKAIERGIDQVGTLGSGNHYLEIQWLKPENIFDEKLAKKWGLFPNQVVIMFHCGSRGFGHQVASDYLQIFLRVMESKYGIKILDRELAAAPFYSKEGQDYFAAMKCAMNMSFANRQLILHRIREVFEKVFKKDAESLGIKQVYDVAHNSAKLEKHEYNGNKIDLLVHRKGATRAFVAGMKEIPKKYIDDGQPVIIGGSMETGSYLLVALPKAKETFYSTAHGSGRTMSREKAKKIVKGKELIEKLEKRGIYVRAVSYSGVAEEAGLAYKNIDEVAEVTELAGISKRIAKLIPIGNIKG
ncbi:MAG: RtcB family protein [Candidatus Pacearchaeota archaeon]